MPASSARILALGARHAVSVNAVRSGWLGEKRNGNICCRVQAACWPSGYPGVMPEMPHTLTAALHREEDWFIAQCLEVDVASQGHTIDEALASLAEAVELYLEEVDDPAGHVTATPLVTSFQLPAA
jgi:predicted RNase H-like HicB family nuclease